MSRTANILLGERFPYKLLNSPSRVLNKFTGIFPFLRGTNEFCGEQKEVVAHLSTTLKLPYLMII